LPRDGGIARGFAVALGVAAGVVDEVADIRRFDNPRQTSQRAVETGSRLILTGITKETASPKRQRRPSATDYKDLTKARER
jgi:hypothetical protein